ncbi:MAG TPA: pseudouridine synthase, partial [Lentimicrobium sp.]|nr:pseudouridine synthase [Lentimicrobium sp.]
PRRFKKDDTEKREGDSTHTREYKKGYGDKPYAEREGKREYKPGRRTSDKEAESGTRPDRKAGRDYTSVRPPRFRNEKAGSSAKPKGKRGFGEDGTIRLNKYLANAGICSRREADTLIESGAVSVNGKVVTLLGTRISMDDKVQFGGETLSIERKVYLLLNKPKGYITTVDDPQDRNTVMMLVKDACRERIYPVGRLDRNTTGLLLFTNDGELAKKLTHPGHKVRKVYHVELNKGLAKSDMARLSEGIELEDGMMAVDEIAYTGSGDDKKNIGVVIHSGRNRVVRRMFESLDYEVTKLDRVAFANLTKKDLPRGRWRFLEQTEINMLMMI